MKYFKLFENFIAEAVNKKILLGRGLEQSAYEYPEDPNYVLKVYDRSAYRTRTAEQAVDKLVQLSNQYPDIVADVKRISSNEYLQQKLDIKKLDRDIIAECIKVWNELAKDYEAVLKSSSKSTVAQYIKTRVEYGMFESGKPSPVKNEAQLEDVFDDMTFYSNYVLFLVDSYVYDNYTNKSALVKKLKPILDNDELNGDPDNSNMGYDKRGNIKVLDI